MSEEVTSIGLCEVKEYAGKKVIVGPPAAADTPEKLLHWVMTGRVEESEPEP